MQTDYSFTDYSKKISFLQGIPNPISSQLSVDEFYFPDEIVEKARKALEVLFDHHIMTYKASAFNKNMPLWSHLCANYKGAKLTEEQLSLLGVYEERFKQRGVRFVIYQRPLTKISIQQSPFYQ